MNSMLTSFIVPDAMLFEELELKKHKRAIAEKTPVVDNPVEI